MISHVPAVNAYPGITRLSVNGKTYVSLGIWTEDEMTTAIGDR